MSKRKPRRRNFVLSVAAGALAQGCYAASGNSPDPQSPPPGTVVNAAQPPPQAMGTVAVPVGLIPPPVGKVITPYDAGQGNNPDHRYPMGMVVKPVDAGKPDASHPPILGSIAFPGVVVRPPDAAIDEDAG